MCAASRTTHAEVTAQRRAHLRDHGVTSDYAGRSPTPAFGRTSVNDLALARYHGVDARQAAAIHAAILALTMTSLAMLRDHCVRPELVRALADARIRSMSDRDIARLADHGVTPALIQAAAAARHGEL